MDPRLYFKAFLRLIAYQRTHNNPIEQSPNLSGMLMDFNCGIRDFDGIIKLS